MAEEKEEEEIETFIGGDRFTLNNVHTIKNTATRAEARLNLSRKLDMTERFKSLPTKLMDPNGICNLAIIGHRGMIRYSVERSYSCGTLCCSEVTTFRMKRQRVLEQACCWR